MTDEKFEFMQDCRDKKITARSAKNKRTHNGKDGRVRFPSDNLTKKEREAMNGECKSYRMNEPMTWKDFKELPDDLKKAYIKNIRNRWNVPDMEIAKMMGVSGHTVSLYFTDLDLSLGKNGRKCRTWDKEGFYAWRGLAKDGVVEASETPIAEDSGACIQPEDPMIIYSAGPIIAVNDEPELVIQEEVHNAPNDKAEAMYEAFKKSIAECKPVAVPTNIYEGAYNYMPVIPKSGSMTFEHNNADDALATIKALLSNIKVNITVSWESVT